MWNLPSRCLLIRSRLRRGCVPTRRGRRYSGSSSISLGPLIVHALSAISVFTDLLFAWLLLIIRANIDSRRMFRMRCHLRATFIRSCCARVGDVSRWIVSSNSSGKSSSDILGNRRLLNACDAFFLCIDAVELCTEPISTDASLL